MRLKNPKDNLAAIHMDYKDKHPVEGSVVMGRKFDAITYNENGEMVIDKIKNKAVTHRQFCELQKLIPSEAEYVRLSHFPSEKKHNDCYATINSFQLEYEPEIEIKTRIFDGKESKKKVKHYRLADKLAYLTGFYLDFDHRKIHEIAKSHQAPPDLAKEVLSYAAYIVETLESYLPSDFGMPVISMTGGGYGFYLPLKPLPATSENIELYKMVHEKLYRRFNSLFAELLEVFDHDHSVVGDIVRVIRITGTYNWKTSVFAEYIARYGNEEGGEVYRYHLEELVELYRLNDIENDIPNKRLVKDDSITKEKERRGEKKKRGSRLGSYDHRRCKVLCKRLYQ
ncbi:MAG: hypothetical protein J1E03_06995 [Acetatifactor sp.]|nr:hypothetical protein [Acetatifactor sp.]